MFPSGIIILFSLAFLKRNSLFLGSISLKYLVLAVLLLKVDYFIYFGFFEYGNQTFIFHSIFTGIIILTLIKAIPSLNPDKFKVSIFKSFTLGFSISVLCSMLLGFIPINHFWPIPDSDLSFSLLASLFFSTLSTELIIILYLSIEFVSLFVYGKVLILKIASNKGNGLDIKRASILIKIQKYLFMALLFIFFVTYSMNLSSFQSLFNLSYISYLIVIVANSYMTLKTDFSYVG